MYFKRKNKAVVQSSVLQSKKKQFRISGKDLKQFEDHFYYAEENESLFIKTLIKEALDKRESDMWEEELKDF